MERNCLPSQKVATSRTGIRNVTLYRTMSLLTSFVSCACNPQVSGSAKNSAGTDVLEPYYPLKEGEEAHWEVSGSTKLFEVLSQK